MEDRRASFLRSISEAHLCLNLATLLVGPEGAQKPLTSCDSCLLLPYIHPTSLTESPNPSSTHSLCNMEHLFDEIEAAAASARYRSPPPSVASTRYSECDTQSQYDSDTETNIWSKYYPRPQCPPGPLGYPKPRSPEEYKVFKWKEQQRQQSTDSLQTPRPNLPGFNRSTRPPGASDASTSKLPGFGNYRRGPGTVTATVSHRPTPSWEATLQAVNAASGSITARSRKVCSVDPFISSLR